MVSGGVRRVECVHVTCEDFVVRGVLHATLHVKEDDVEILLDTTNRTMKFKSVLRNSQNDEIAPATLPGGRLRSASTLETHLWMNLEKDPQGMISWNSTVIHYASFRASEWVVRSGLYHESFGKVLKLGGQIIAEPTSAHMIMMFDVFSELEDALNLQIKFQNDHGSQIMIANLTKTFESQPRIMDIVVSFLPSPDSGQVSVVLIVPTDFNVDGTSDLQNTNEYSNAHFKLTCGLDAPNEYTTISCRLTAPSVDEKVYARYQLMTDAGCRGLSTSLGILGQAYYAQQKSCRNPNSFQASISTKTEKHHKQELALKLGVLDTQNAELDIIDAIHIKFQLHPPFLLHTVAHSRGDLWSRWEDFKTDVQSEVTELLDAATSVAETLTSDVQALRSLSRVVSPSPVLHLATYTSEQSEKLLGELHGDELIKEIAQGAQICIDVTSVLVEAAMAYLNNNYGKMIMDLGMRISEWATEAVTNVGSWIENTALGIYEAFSSTVTFLTDIPKMTLDYAMTIPVIADGFKWMADQFKIILESNFYAALSDASVITGHYINWGLFLLYPGSEDLLKNEFVSGAWNVWIPLPECSHSLLDVWNMLSGTNRTSLHRFSLLSALQRLWNLLLHPSAFLLYLTPPFPAYGSVIGETNFISLDGRTYETNSSCAHILLTDARDDLFTLVSELHGSSGKRSYTLFIGESIITVLPDLQVTLDGSTVTLPYTSEMISITRDLEQLTVESYDNLGRQLLTLCCWTYQQACVIGVSGWLHSDTRGLLGYLNMDPADDLMRPSGQMALSGEIFSESWRIGSECSADRTTMEIPSHTRARQLCRKFILDFQSPTYPCQETVDIRPYYETCLRYLASLENEERDNNGHQDPPLTTSSSHSTSDHGPSLEDIDWSNINALNTSTTESPEDNFSSISLHINVRDLIFPFVSSESDIVDATKEELEALCNIMTAYFAVCKTKDLKIALPHICGPAGKLNYNEPVSSYGRQVDIVMLIDESSCDSFIYEHLIHPLPEVMERIAHGKNISDVKMAAVGYGSGGGDIIYHIAGPSLLTSTAQLRLSQPHGIDPPKGSLVEGLRAVSDFPFRPGSVRAVLVLRCSNQDIPQFTDTLLREMTRRRLILFTLTPDLLVFNPTRPKAVRNTIGVDRWRVYSLRHDKQKSEDSWGVRKPNSNIAQLAMKSGGGVFTVTPLREESRSGYYMKLFRKVLSRAILKSTNSVYNYHSKENKGSPQQ